MKPKKTLLLSLALLTSFIPSVKGQDAASALISAAGGAAGLAVGKIFEDDWSGAPYAGAGLGALLGNWGYNSFRKKTDAEKMKFYISGANYQRWIMSQETWYQSTLNPHTGRPQAFSGLEEMDSGMPAQAAGQNTKTDISKVFTVPVRLPAGTYKGVPHTERIGNFPKLP